MSAATNRQLQPDPLLREITVFDARFRGALGDWRRIERVRGFSGRDDDYPNWVGATTERSVVLAVIIAWLVGWPKRPMPASTAVLLEAALELFEDPNELEQRVSRRLRSALEEVVPTWHEPAQAVKAVVVNTCARLVRSGVQMMLDRGGHARLEHAIVLVAATAEVLRARKSEAAALKFLDGLVAKHRKHRDFTSQLRIRRCS